jgi:hypothetical protein
MDEFLELDSYKGYGIQFAPKDVTAITLHKPDEDNFGKYHYRCDIRAYHSSQRRDLPDIIFSLRISQVDAASEPLNVLQPDGPQDKLWSHLRVWAEDTTHTLIDKILA